MGDKYTDAQKKASIKKKQTAYRSVCQRERRIDGVLPPQNAENHLINLLLRPLKKKLRNSTESPQEHSCGLLLCRCLLYSRSVTVRLTSQQGGCNTFLF